MAVPVLSILDNKSAKTAGTTSLGSTAATPIAIGDYLIGCLATDPGSGGAVAFANTAGTFSAWTVVQDVSNGSGTAGVRTVVAYAKCTAAATSGMTCTFPATGAVVSNAFTLTGADGTTPVMVSGVGTAASGSVTATLTVPATADVVGLLWTGIEQTGGATPATGLAFSGTGDTFVASSRSTTTWGTSGGSATSNISNDYIIETCAAITTNNVSATSKDPTTNQAVAVLFQNVAGAVAAVLPELVMAPSRGF